jgi:GNAT superfamily N-acetyltransferase
MPDSSETDGDTRLLLLNLQSAAAAAMANFGQIVPVPPFVAMFHPTDPMVYRNQALPDGDGVVPDAELDRAVAETIGEFRRRGRIPRFEFSPDLWPTLAEAMARHGLRLQSTVPMMVCTSGELQPYRADGLRLDWLKPSDDRECLREVITVQRRAFEPTWRGASDADVNELIAKLESGGLRTAVARIGDAVAGAAGLSGKGDVVELGGVATDEKYRGKGVARALSLFLAQAHLDAGGAFIFLTAGNETARRVYERIGFRMIGEQLHYIDAAWEG